MGKAFIKEETLTAIGDAIRAKTGETAAMLPSAMAGAITNMKTGGGSGSYVWTKQGMGESISESTSSGTYTLTTANNTKPSAEIEYSTAAPTYNNTKRQWIFADSTKMTLTNSDATLPSISGNVYCRDMSEPNVWYLVSAFSKGSSSPYLKSMTYSKKITAPVDWAKKYLTDADGEKYPVGGWSDGYHYKRTVADPNAKKGDGTKWIKNTVFDGQYDHYYGSIYYAEGLWVAGDSYGLYYSTDGKTWTKSDIDATVYSPIEYANGLWVAGGNEVIYYSTDGKNWTQINITDGGILVTIFYGNGKWVAGGSKLYYSTNGRNWFQGSTPGYSNTSGSFNSVYYGNGIWVAGNLNPHVYSSAGIWYSTNGENWTQSNVGGQNYICEIHYANGLWVAGGGMENGLYYSTNGKNWTQSNITDSSIKFLNYDNGMWVASGYANGGNLYYSTNGRNWSKINNLGSFIKYTVYVTNKWIAATDNGLYYSNDLTTWYQSNITVEYFNFVCFGNGVYVAISGKGIYHSIGEIVEVDF